VILDFQPFLIFFMFIHYSHATYLDHGEIMHSPFFPSAVRAVAARCKLPFGLRPGLSQEDGMRTNENNQGKDKGKRQVKTPNPLPRRP